MTMENDHWYVYIIRDKNNRLYTGISNNVQKRVSAHISGKGAKFLKGVNPLELVYCSESLTKTQAAQFEYKIKKLNKKTKEGLIEGKTDITQFFALFS